VTTPATAPGSPAASFDRWWAELAPVGRDPAGGYRRLAYTAPELELREWFVATATGCGLDVEEDRAGNLWAWWGPPSPPGAESDRRAIVAGSHLDSVPRGGAFDGPLGVVSALVALEELRRRGLVPRRPVAAVVFADEEGGRFGVACAGSRLLTGQLAPARARSLTDGEGVSLAAALRAAGRDPADLGPDPERVAAIGAYVELHIEQGRRLVDLDTPLGIGSMIRPHGRWRFDLVGRADHAGTTRLCDRDDPMLAQARLVLEARSAAEACGGSGAVATVGRVVVEPNAVNAIPGRVTAWLDARADAEADVRAIVARVSAEVGVAAREESWSPAVRLDPSLADDLARILAPGWGTLPRLATGAGHDAGILATAGVPTAMLHVRNPTGVSHAPQEHAERDDCLAGVAALTDVLAVLATSS
jgi:beta-ureidopropionase / N-carbamoyl-L-amino-acid hydrolase